jgi:hypothetical protein
VVMKKDAASACFPFCRQEYGTFAKLKKNRY